MWCQHSAAKSFANISLKIIFGVYFSKYFYHSIYIFWNQCTKLKQRIAFGCEDLLQLQLVAVRARLSIRQNGSTYDLTRSKVTVTVSNKENAAFILYSQLLVFVPLNKKRRKEKKQNFLTRFLWLNKGISSGAEQIINIIFETISHNVSNLRARIDDE